MEAFQLPGLGTHQQYRIPGNVIDVVIPCLLQRGLAADHLPYSGPKLLDLFLKYPAVGPDVSGNNVVGDIGLCIQA